MRATALTLGVAFLAASAAVAADAGLELKARKHDRLWVKNRREPVLGKIERQDKEIVEIRPLDGIKRSYSRKQVVRIQFACTLEGAYREASRAAGKSPLAHFRLHEQCLKAGLKKQAIAELREAIRVDGAYQPAYYALAELARTWGDLNLEIEILDAAGRRGITAPSLILRQAEIRVQLGLAESAAALLEKKQDALSREPFNTEARLRLAMLDLVFGNAARARGRLKRMNAKDPRRPVAEGQIELAEGRPGQAEAAFQQALRGSKSAVAAACLGGLALRRGKVDAARDYYDAALEIRPGFAPALAGKGLTLARGEKLREAAAWLDRAIAAAPKRADIAAARGYVAERAGDHKRALKLYEQARSLDRRNVHALAGAGRCHWRLGAPEKARESFSQALVLRPGFAPALRGMGHVTAETDPAGAAGHFTELVRPRAGDRGGPRPRDYAALAAALLRGRRYHDASAQLARAGSANAHAYAARGFLAYTLGRVKEARTHLEDAAKHSAYRGYADNALRLINEAERTVTWSDLFDRADAAAAGKGWTEAPDSAIAVVDRTLQVDGRAPAEGGMIRLSRPEAKSADGMMFSSITARGSSRDTGSFAGVFVCKPGGPSLLFGRSAGGGAAVRRPKVAEPAELGAAFPDGGFRVRVEITDRKTGAVRLSLPGRKPRWVRELTVPEFAGAESYEVGVFVLPPQDQKAHSAFHEVTIERSK